MIPTLLRELYRKCWVEDHSVMYMSCMVQGCTLALTLSQMLSSVQYSLPQTVFHHYTLYIIQQFLAWFCWKLNFVEMPSVGEHYTEFYCDRHTLVNKICISTCLEVLPCMPSDLSVSCKTAFRYFFMFY